MISWSAFVNYQSLFSTCWKCECTWFIDSPLKPLINEMLNYSKEVCLFDCRLTITNISTVFHSVFKMMCNMLGHAMPDHLSHPILGIRLPWKFEGRNISIWIESMQNFELHLAHDSRNMTCHTYIWSVISVLTHYVKLDFAYTHHSHSAVSRIGKTGLYS